MSRRRKNNTVVLNDEPQSSETIVAKSTTPTAKCHICGKYKDNQKMRLVRSMNGSHIGAYEYHCTRCIRKARKSNGEEFMEPEGLKMSVSKNTGYKLNL